MTGAVGLWLGESGACIGGRTGIGLDGFLQLSLGRPHGLKHEFCCVVAAQQQVVAVKRALRQTEGLVSPPIFIEVTDVQTRVVAVITARGEENPATIGAPGVVALRFIGVERLSSLSHVLSHGSKADNL